MTSKGGGGFFRSRSPSAKRATNSSLLSCYCSSRTHKSPQPSKTNAELLEKPPPSTQSKGFFKRIQFFKAQKRKSSARKQQLAAAAAISNGCLSATDDDQPHESIDTYGYSHHHHPIRNSQSIPLFDQDEKLSPRKLHDIPYETRGLHETTGDSYSFTDIEVASSLHETEPNRLNHPDQSRPERLIGTPKSFVSRDFSSATTNLSAYSTQSLLRRLVDKAQVLNEYYNDVCHKSIPNSSHHHPLSLSSHRSSSNSLLGRTPRSFLHRDSSNGQILQRHNNIKHRSVYDNFSPDSSRYNLYADEDNVLRELIRFNNDIDLILSRLEMESGNNQQQQQTLTSDVTQQQQQHYSSSSQILLDEEPDRQSTESKLDEFLREQQAIIYPSDDSGLAASPPINDRDEIEQTILFPTDMRTNTNEINVHLLLSNDINRLRETALSKLLKLVQQHCPTDVVHNQELINLNKLNKLPKATLWKGKHVFGVPLRIYQQNTGQILPIAITNALQYVRMNAGKCEGLFRKPGVKSKIDRLRAQIELNHGCQAETITETIKFDDYQPFVVADVIRQYFRELPECLMPPSITRLLCDLIKCVPQEEQLLAMRYAFLLLPDETRDVLETILRFLLDVAIRSGSSQTTCRSLARIFVPSVFQSYHDMHTSSSSSSSSKVLWWKWKKEKMDAIAQENERLTLELCLMTMILNVDLLCRVPGSLADELKLPTARKTKRLDDLVRGACNGEFQMKKYIAKESEHFLQRLSNTKFKTIQTNFDGVDVSIHRPSAANNENILPTWKCSIDIPNTNVKQVSQRLLHERYLWDRTFAESRTVEKIDDDKEIVQYVLNFLDLVPVRSFCEFRFSKRIASRSTPDINAMLIGAVSIDHLQNHFLPGSIGITHDMHYYITPSSTHPGHTTVTQVACVDFSGRSSQWYENVFGSLLAHNLVSLRETFTNSKIIKI